MCTRVTMVWNAFARSALVQRISEFSAPNVFSKKWYGMSELIAIHKNGYSVQSHQQLYASSGLIVGLWDADDRVMRLEAAAHIEAGITLTVTCVCKVEGIDFVYENISIRR